MIVYCGLRHFYVRHFKPPQFADVQPDAYYILTHNKEVWDFSPELKEHGFTNQAKGQAVLHLDKPVFTLSIDLTDFASFAKKWHEFSRQYTHELEVEYPHAWYLRFQQPTILEQFILDFSTKLHQEADGGIWGAGHSKLVAKLAAHNLTGSKRVIAPEHTGAFLNKLPLHRLPLAEQANLEKLGIKTLGELGEIPLIELESHFGAKAVALQKIGQGEDLVPFQAEQIQEYSWSLDCTILEGFLRPLEPWELKPYLEQGAKQLAQTLKEKHQVAGKLLLEVWLTTGEACKKERQFKGATDDVNRFTHALESLLPQEPIVQVEVVVSELAPSPIAQLSMFWEPQTAKLTEDELHPHAQLGIELPRRERILLLWEEWFS